MSRKYIDRELLINEICKNRLMSKELVAQKILHIINEQPTVNVEEVRHGKWINHSGGEWGCSSCANIVFTEGSWETPYDNYCPYCGAKMDKEQE